MHRLRTISITSLAHFGETVIGIVTPQGIKGERKLSKSYDLISLR